MSGRKPEGSNVLVAEEPKQSWWRGAGDRFLTFGKRGFSFATAAIFLTGTFVAVADLYGDGQLDGFDPTNDKQPTPEPPSGGQRTGTAGPSASPEDPKAIEKYEQAVKSHIRVGDHPVDEAGDIRHPEAFRGHLTTLVKMTSPGLSDAQVGRVVNEIIEKGGWTDAKGNSHQLWETPNGRPYFEELPTDKVKGLPTIEKGTWIFDSSGPGIGDTPEPKTEKIAPEPEAAAPVPEDEPTEPQEPTAPDPQTETEERPSNEPRERSQPDYWREMQIERIQEDLDRTFGGDEGFMRVWACFGYRPLEWFLETANDYPYDCPAYNDFQMIQSFLQRNIQP